MIKEKKHIYTTTPKKKKKRKGSIGRHCWLPNKQPFPHRLRLLLPFSLNPDFTQVFWNPVLLQVKLLSDSEG